MNNPEERQTCQFPFCFPNERVVNSWCGIYFESWPPFPTGSSYEARCSVKKIKLKSSEISFSSILLFQDTVPVVGTVWFFSRGGKLLFSKIISALRTHCRKTSSYLLLLIQHASPTSFSSKTTVQRSNHVGRVVTYTSHLPPYFRILLFPYF